MCVSGMLPNTQREGKRFFAEKQANGGRIFMLSEEILKVSPHYKRANRRLQEPFASSGM